MKKIKSIMLSVLAVVAIGLTAQAADTLRVGGGIQSVFTSGASTVGDYFAGVTNNTTMTLSNAVMQCAGGKELCIQFKSELHTSGTTANSFTLQGSVDGVNWTSVTPISTPTIAWTPAGTTPVIVVTNITIGALPYVRLRTIVNANGNTDSYVTNYSLKYFVK